MCGPKFPHDLISGPSHGVLVSTIFASFLVSFAFFCLPSLVRAKVPSASWASRVGIHHPAFHAGAICTPRCYTSVMSQASESSQSLHNSPWAAAPSLQEVMAINLPLLHNVSQIPYHPLLPSSNQGWWGLFYFQGTRLYSISVMVLFHLTYTHQTLQVACVK